MEIYILDSLYRRITVVDTWVSFIWTERYSATGDFQLVVNSTLANRNLFIKGTKLAMSSSYRVMTVETAQDALDEQGNRLLTITGPSLESVLTQRLARGALDDSTSDPQWVLTGTPVEIANQMFHDVCVEGLLDPGDIIAGVTEASIFPADTVPPPPDEIEYSVDPQTLYDAEVALCNQYLLGFRLVRDISSGLLYWDVYSGSNRTSHQTALPAVVFSEEFDNLQNVTELSSVATYKNVAYVITPVGCAIVYADNVDPAIAGFDRRVLIVTNTDITDTDPPTALAQMMALGTQQLALNRQTAAFDGAISQTSKYVYGIDYNLGDLIEYRNSDGVSNTMQVTEQIFSSDNTGVKSYPTLIINEFVTPGSWDAEPPGVSWTDLADDDYWDDRP